MAIYSLGRRRVIALLVLTSLLLITLDTRGNVLIDKARSAFSLVLSPFDTAARTITRPIENAWRAVTDYDDLRRENEELREQLNAQRGAEIEAQATILEFQDLLLLNRLETPGNIPSVVAEVQGQAPTNFRYTVEIDKGSTDGIAVGMPVINGGGLVGKITSVSPTSSVVLLITDPEYSIGVKVLTAVEADDPTQIVDVTPDGDTGVFGAEEETTTTSSTTTTSTTTTTTIPLETTTTGYVLDENGRPVAQTTVAAGDSTTSSTLPGFTTTTLPEIIVIRETGTLSGQGKGLPPIIRFVDDSSTTGRLQVGSSVQTAGGEDSVAPAGLPVGVVSRVTSQTGSSSLLVEVEPGAGDLTRLNYLRVLLYVPGG